MPRNIQYYSQANHTVQVTNGVWTRTLRDFGPDNAISWEFLNADKVAVTEGLDASRLSFASGTGGQIGVVLKATSNDVGFLTNLLRNQMRGVPELLTVTIWTGVNEVHVLRNAGVKKDGNETGGPTMSDRKFYFVGEELNEDEEYV